jgi:hypothetical protein
MLFKVLYPFVLDGKTKLPHTFVDIDDHGTAMRLLEIGVIVVVQVPEKPAQPGISADEPEPAAETTEPSAETTEPTVTYHAVMFHTATRFDQHERGWGPGLIRRAWARWRRR